MCLATVYGVFLSGQRMFCCLEVAVRFEKNMIFFLIQDVLVEAQGGGRATRL